MKERIKVDGHLEYHRAWGVLKIDAQDEGLLQGKALCVKAGYARLRDNHGHRVNLARAIMLPLTGFQVDHINHDTLDNRRSNLRTCTPSENARNNSGHGDRKGSRFKGVSFDPHGDRAATGRMWRAYTRVNGKRIYFGYHHTEEQAARAYNEGAKRLFGAYAKANGV